jgi:hypothetical protein
MEGGNSVGKEDVIYRFLVLVVVKKVAMAEGWI